MNEKMNLITALSKPALYTKTKSEFWNDPYISKQMLAAHLDTEFEAASRKLTFIEDSVKWINQLVPASKYQTLLDIGCGPGLYAERFQKLGYEVTGMDFSKRSIAYAINSALTNHQDITYLYQNYLTMELGKQFDVCTLIYCDYGALSTEDRNIIMQKVYEHLKPGGRFILDVFTMHHFAKFKEGQSWQICKDGGFWRSGEYIEITGNYSYLDHVTLNQTTIVEENDITTYYIWDTSFTEDSLKKEAEDAGFKVCGIYGDVAGTTFHDESDTMAIVLEK